MFRRKNGPVRIPEVASQQDADAGVDEDEDEDENVLLNYTHYQISHIRHVAPGRTRNKPAHE